MRGLLILSLLALAGLAGCASQQPASAARAQPAFFVPSAAVMGSRTALAQANMILPGSDGDYDIPRAQKDVAYYGDTSYYTIYTYDMQQISVPHTGSSGYRYRWMVQEGGSP